MVTIKKSTISRWLVRSFFVLAFLYPHWSVSAQSSINLYTSGKEFSNWEIQKPVRDIRGIVTFGGSLWIASSGGLIQYDAEKDTIQAQYRKTNSVLDDSNITMVKTSGDSLMFVGTSNGLHFIRANGETRSLTNNNSDFPISAVNAADYDVNGTLWIGMSTGLVKMAKDGAIRFYSSLNSPLNSDHIYDILAERDGSVLVSTTNLYRITSDDEWVNLNHPGDDDRIYKIEKHGNGIIYTQSDGTGLQKFENGNWSYVTTKNSGIKSNYVKAFSIDENGRLWVGYWTSGLSSANKMISMFDGQTWNHTEVSGSLFQRDYIYPRVIHVADGTVWAGLHWEGLFSLRNFSDSTSVWTKKHITPEYLFPQNIRWMHVDDNDRVWINNERSLLMFDEEQWTSFDHVFRVSKNISKIDSDKSGNIWFTSYAGSFGYFHPETEEVAIWNEDNFEGLPINSWRSINNLSVDETGIAWITISSVGLLRYNGTEWEIIEEEENPYNYGYQSQLGTGFNGDVFVSKGDNLKRYKDGEWTKFYGFPGHWRHLTAIAADKDGAAWAGGDHESYGLGPPGTGLAMVTETGRTVYDVGNSDLPGRHIRSIHVDHNNHIWVATWNSGIAHFDREDWVAYTRGNSPIVSQQIQSIGTQSDGDVWIASDSELYKIEDGIEVSVEEYPERQRPDAFTLYPNYPNPFNPSTTLRFDVERTTNVRIEVFSSLGERVDVITDKAFAPGTHEVVFDAANLSSGVYFFRFVTPEATQTVKGILMK